MEEEKKPNELSDKERAAFNRAAKSVGGVRASWQNSLDVNDQLAFIKEASFNRSADTTIPSSFFSPNSMQSGGQNAFPNVGRIALLYVDPLFDPILLMFPKENIKELNRRLRHYYSYEPYVRNLIDLHSEFALSDFELKCEDKAIEREFNEFKDKINLLELFTQWNRDFWLLGESIAYGNWDDSNLTWKSFNQYPPENVDIHRVYIGPGVVYFLKPDEELRKILNSPTEVNVAISKNIPSEFRESMRSGKPYLLDTDRVIHLAKKPSGYTIRGESIVKSILKDLLYEDKLRLLQYTFVDRHLFPIKLWKLGSKEHKWIPPPSHFAQFQQLLAQSMNDPDFNIVYHPFIEADFISSQGKYANLLTEFDWVAKRILVGLFGTEAMLGGSGNPYANEAVSMKVVMHRYLKNRNMIENIARQKIFLPMCIRRGYVKKNSEGTSDFSRYDVPRFFWRKQNILNNTSEMEMMIRLRDKQEIPFSIIADIFGWDSEAVAKAWEHEHSTPNDPVWRKAREEAAKSGKVREQILDGTKTPDLVIPEAIDEKKSPGRPPLPAEQKKVYEPSIVSPESMSPREKHNEKGEAPKPKE